MKFTTYDDYVELFSEWQAKLLDIADKILVTSNVHLRIYWRKQLARTFVQFLEAVNKIELKIVQHTMTPSINIDRLQKLKMNSDDATTREGGIFDDATEDSATVDANDFNEFDYDEEGSVDMMFDDLNVLRDEYQQFLRMIANNNGDDDEELLDEIAHTLATSFKTIRDAIIHRLHWNESIANDAIGWIDRPRTNIYLQNTGRDIPVVETDVVARMVDETDYNYSVMVPVRLFHDDGSYEDYNTSGRRI